MAHQLELSPDLEAVVARRILQPAVRRITAAAAERVRHNAPDAKTWITMRDERVRPSHFATDTQTIPANLRFRVPKTNGTGVELARAPRDPSLHIGNRINCRCESVPVAGAIARTVATSEVVVDGPAVHASVSAMFERLVESEYPDHEDGGGGWMRRALVETAEATRAGASARR